MKISYRNMYERITWADEIKNVLTVRTDLEEFILLNCGNTFEMEIDVDPNHKPSNSLEMPLKDSLWNLSNYKVRFRVRFVNIADRTHEAT